MCGVVDSRHATFMEKLAHVFGSTPFGTNPGGCRGYLKGDRDAGTLSYSLG
jgi:hypothetical protein